MKRILISIIIMLSIISFGCTNKQDEENKEAENSLISFFSYLEEENYEKALNLFEPENGRDRLGNFSLKEDRNNKSKILENYCKATNTCLEIKILEINKETNDTYNYLVQFITKDNDIFVLGPCCGASEEEMPPKDKFNFKVKKINNSFKVITPPVYVP